MKKILILFFILPLIFNTLNLQDFIAIFVSSTAAQVLAYLNLALILVGTVLCIKEKGLVSATAKLWIVFFACYYTFGLIASVYTKYTPSLAKTLIPVIYFYGFYVFLSNVNYRKITFRVITICLVTACIMLVILYNLNFDLDYGGVHIYKIDRAGGLYGDANNAALVCILAYLFFNKFFVAKNHTQKALKILGILFILYSLFLTFSTTGLSTFLIVLLLSNYKYFRGIRIMFLVVAFISLFLVVLNLQSITKDMNLSSAQRVKIENLTNVITLNTDKVDNSGRGDLLANLMSYIYENPIIGNGVDFAVSIRGHNTYMGVWADAGIFVFILFCIILLTHLFRALKLELQLKFFVLSVVFTLCVFMLSLQTVINQAYIMVIFCTLGYLIDFGEDRSPSPIIP
ncbi:O-antigen ligase family protein [Winogradskyella sp. PC D3.3]